MTVNPSIISCKTSLLTLVFTFLCTSVAVPSRADTPLTHFEEIPSIRPETTRGLQAFFQALDYDWAELEQGVPLLILENIPYDIDQIASIKAKKSAFFMGLLPMVLLANQEIKQEYIRHSRRHWFAVDPSESICSDQIEAALNRYFHVRLKRPYGGTILNPLLEHIVANFSMDDDHDVVILRILGYLEQILIAEGVVDNNFAVFAAQPKRGPLQLLSLPHQIRDHFRVARWRLEQDGET